MLVELYSMCIFVSTMYNYNYLLYMCIYSESHYYCLNTCCGGCMAGTCADAGAGFGGAVVAV